MLIVPTTCNVRFFSFFSFGMFNISISNYYNMFFCSHCDVNAFLFFFWYVQYFNIELLYMFFCSHCVVNACFVFFFSFRVQYSLIQTIIGFVGTSYNPSPFFCSPVYLFLKASNLSPHKNSFIS